MKRKASEAGMKGGWDGRTWWLKSASMMMTNVPVQKFRPWTYAVLQPKDDSQYHAFTVLPQSSLPESQFPCSRSQHLSENPHQQTWEYRHGGEEGLTTLSSPYIPANCFATSCVPSGEASSTMMISHARLLFPTKHEKTRSQSTETARNGSGV